MRLGIIIVYQGEGEQLDWDCSIDWSKYLAGLDICLVNKMDVKGSTDRLAQHLEGYRNLSVLNLRKSRSERSSIRAGARFMYSRAQFEHLGHISCSSCKDIHRVLKMAQAHKEAIIHWNQNRHLADARKASLLHRVFSLSKFYQSIEMDCPAV